MSPAVRLALLFAWCCQRSWSQAPLQHVGEDCYFSCWKTPGFCDWCGAGNACCRAGDHDTDPKECQGPLVYKANGEFHECVVASFLPGNNPPAQLQSAGKVTDLDQAQCISYMAKHGCGWTNKYSCPNQPEGTHGLAVHDDSIGYKCCCTNGLWSESATVGDETRLQQGDVTKAKCHSSGYLTETGCGWTQDYRCPTQPAGQFGSKGVASNDGSMGYKCCCEHSFWQSFSYINGAVITTTLIVDNSAFNVDTPFENNRPTLIPENQDSGFAVHVAPGSEHGIHAGEQTGTGTGFLDNHKGVNVRVSTYHQTDADFTPTEHHGPINNKFSKNTVETKKERCTFGICADLDSNNPDLANLPATAHGSALPNEAVVGGQELPSYKVKVKKDNKIKIEKVEGGVETVINPSAPALPGVPKAKGKAAPAPAPAPVVETTLNTPVQPGTTVLPVASNTGFQIGDMILVGNAETRTITGFGSLILDSPLTGTYPAGTPIQKVPAIAAKAATPAEDPAAAGKAGEGSSAGSQTSSGGYGILITVVILVCCCLVGGGGAAFMLSGRKKKSRSTDREAYLKNDFIERQPVYQETPGSAQEMEPMIKEAPPMANAAADVNAEAAEAGDQRELAVEAQAPVVVPLQPTTSFPLQVGVPTTTVPATAPSGVSFPGMPTIGTSMYTGQAASNYMTTVPYGNYASPSAYVSAPSAYSQQLGMTTSIQAMPGASQYVYRQ